MSIYDADIIEPPEPKDKAKPDSYGVASRGPGKVPQIRNNDKVNRHIAALLVRYGMDYEAVVEKMLPEGTPEAHIKMLANVIEQRPGVERFLQERLIEVGLDVETEKNLKAVLVRVALTTKHKHWPSAMKQAGDYFGWAKKSDDNDKPVTLVLKGFEKDLEELFDGAVPNASATMPKRRPIIEKEVNEEPEEPDSVQ